MKDETEYVITRMGEIFKTGRRYKEYRCQLYISAFQYTGILNSSITES